MFEYKLYFVPSISILSSTFDNITCLLAGGVSGATNSPWYFLVLIPNTVEDPYPPIPFVISHSLVIPSFKSISFSPLLASDLFFHWRHLWQLLLAFV